MLITLMNLQRYLQIKKITYFNFLIHWQVLVNIIIIYVVLNKQYYIKVLVYKSWLTVFILHRSPLLHETLMFFSLFLDYRDFYDLIWPNYILIYIHLDIIIIQIFLYTNKSKLNIVKN